MLIIIIFVFILLMENIMKKILGALLLMTLLLSFFSCKDKNVVSPVPNIPFDITLNLSLPLYSNLQYPLGGIVFVNGGSKGIAILRISSEQFAVFDRHCPYKVEEGCVVTIDPDNIAVLIDSDCCASRFNMVNNGLPDNGPATTGLRSYSYTYNGSVLRIYN